jgi:hypothetical protein
MNPVHSSLEPLFDEPGHFHAMEVPPILLIQLYRCGARSQRYLQTELSNKPLNERPAMFKILWRELLHQAVVDSHQLAFVVILQHQLACTHLGLLSQNYLGAKMPL